MSKVASFKPFYHGENSFVVLDRIKHFSMHSSNGVNYSQLKQRASKGATSSRNLFFFDASLGAAG